VTSRAAGVRPTLALETALWENGRNRVAGVDEVGLGPLAGPVVAAACVLPPGCTPIPFVRDSKALSASVRARLVAEIAAQAIAIGLGAASVAEVERLNVLGASRLAMRRALARIGEHSHTLVDGRDFPAPWLGEHTAIVRGDASCYSISCASIVAKVTRDHLMARLAARHPEYGWEHNAGYPTRQHLAAIRDHGVTPYHRRTFRPVMLALTGVPTGPG
jgi:ribonuclease HII